MEKLKDIVKSVNIFLSLSLWIFGLLAASVWWVVDILLLPKHPWIATAGLATKVALLLLPLRIEPPGFVRRFMQFSMEAGHDYFPVTILWEDKGAFKEGTPYVIGYEPHSVLPQGICTFCQYATDAVPPALRNTRILVSSAGFWAPVMRHLWWWLGCRPVGRQSFKLELSQGRSVALCPGGVQECLYMEPGKEIAYLRKRHGFVRVALEHGAPLVPIFAFGQTEQYKYCRPFLDWPKGIIPKAAWASFARRIGYAPMLVFGVFYFSFMPRKIPLTICVGRPIPLPRTPSPSPELVSEYLTQFIDALEALFEKHKAAAGYPELTLTIY